jgi:hypothetical protein
VTALQLVKLLEQRGHRPEPMGGDAWIACCPCCWGTNGTEPTLGISDLGPHCWNLACPAYDAPDLIWEALGLPVPSVNGGPRSGHLLRLDQVEMEAVTWVRSGWLAKKKLTVVDGMPDVGKSTIMADWSARATRGWAFPGGPGFGRVCGVLIAAGTEDGAADTIKPRVLAAGGDDARVLVLLGMPEEDGGRRPFALPQDADYLLQVIREHDIGLVWLDSLMAALPADVNSHRDQDIRRALHPLAELAEESGAVVVFLRHPTKGGAGPAMYRGGGSVAIVGVARCGLLAVKDPEDESGERRLLAVHKCNLVPEAERRSVTYTIASEKVTSDGITVEVGRVRWGGEDDRSAEDLVRVSDQPDAPERADAARVILEALQQGPLTARQLDSVREDYGIGRHTWEQERARLRREGRIRVDQPGVQGQRGGQDAIWSLVGSPREGRGTQ